MAQWSKDKVVPGMASKDWIFKDGWAGLGKSSKIAKTCSILYIDLTPEDDSQWLWLPGTRH